MKRLLAILILFPSLCLAQATAVIKGPTTVAPGDLVILDATDSVCDALVWSLANSDKSFLPVDEGKQCVFASGTPGSYTFLLATAACGGATPAATIALAKHTVTITGTPPTPPQPDNPTPPKPDNPTPPPDPSLSAIAKASLLTARGVDRKSGEAARLAAVFRSVTAQAKSAGWTTAQIAAAFKKASGDTVFQDQDTKNRWAAYRTFFVDTMKPITDPEAARNAMIEMAIGLEKVDQATTTKKFTAVQVETGVDTPNTTIREKVEALNRSLNNLSQEIGN